MLSPPRRVTARAAPNIKEVSALAVGSLHVDDQVFPNTKVTPQPEQRITTAFQSGTTRLYVVMLLAQEAHFLCNQQVPSRVEG